MKSVATAGYWDTHWSKARFEIAESKHPLRRWIEEGFPEGNGKSCFEAGCYPGKFLALFGRKGYVLSGADSYKGTATALPEWLRASGFKIGDFYEADFTALDTDKRFDLVCSLGLVEHFEEYPNLIGRHVALAKPGGTIAIEVPNLWSPLYRFLYKTLEPKILDHHVPSAMNLENICTALRSHNCTIVKAEYVGHFYFRFVTKNSRILRITQSIINIFRPIFHLLPKSIYARYIAVIATK